MPKFMVSMKVWLLYSPKHDVSMRWRQNVIYTNLLHHPSATFGEKSVTRCVGHGLDSLPNNSYSWEWDQSYRWLSPWSVHKLINICSLCELHFHIHCNHQSQLQLKNLHKISNKQANHTANTIRYHSKARPDHHI